MQPRVYVIALVAVALAVVSAIAGTNLFIDPQGVFGSGLVPTTGYQNRRFLRVEAYKASPDRYDGVMFGSSRSWLFDVSEISRRMDANLADFSVDRATISEHLSVLDFLLRDKAAKHGPMRAAILLLDVDLLGASDSIHSAIQFLQPPAISGGNPVRFWWRNLIGVQFAAWKSGVREAWRTQAVEQIPGANPLDSREDAPAAKAATAQPTGAQPRPVVLIDPPSGTVPPSNWIRARPNYPRDIDTLKRFVALCRERRIRLLIATTPLRLAESAQYDSADLDEVLGEMSRIAPVWDFTTSAQLADSDDLWIDESHFTRKVMRAMVDRMFGKTVPTEWQGFGRLRGS
jgi:hypothetical protein